jgi:hypothetical protein
VIDAARSWRVGFAVFLVLLLLLCGCHRSDPPREPAAPAPSSSCPEEMIRVVGGTFQLGETAKEHKPPVSGAWVTHGEFRVQTFCVARFPFPGVEGAPWPADGLNYAAAVALEGKATLFGRRLCTATEMLLATAGPLNARFPYGASYKPDVCESSEESPQPLGSWPKCRNSLGLRDHLVRSTWVRLDDRMERQLAEEQGPVRPPHLGLARPEGIELALMGGTPRQDTFYAPNNFGIHAHATDSATRFLDDSVRLCASPGEARGDWPGELEKFLAAGRYGVWLESE